MAMNMAYKCSDIFKVCDDDNNNKNDDEEEEGEEDKDDDIDELHVG